MTSMKPPAVEMWVIYQNPADYPARFVARLWRVASTPVPTADFHMADTLEGVRALVPGWATGRLTRIPRSPEDDPVIVETWL